MGYYESVCHFDKSADMSLIMNIRLSVTKFLLTHLSVPPIATWIHSLHAVRNIVILKSGQIALIV